LPEFALEPEDFERFSALRVAFVQADFELLSVFRSRPLALERWQY
jgi:hypothetical protein